MNKKEERKERTDPLVGCSNVSRWIDGKPNEKIAQIPEGIKALLYGHIIKCPTCSEAYKDILLFLREE